MIWLALAGAALLVIMPIRVTTDVHAGLRKLLRLRIGMAQIHKEWLLEAIATPQGHRLVIAGKGHEPHSLSAQDMHSGPADSAMRLLHSARSARQFLLQHMHAEQLDAQLLLHTSSAASTALLTGAIQTALHLLPRRWLTVARVRVLPDFLRERSTLQARCIFRIRVGTILITAGLLLASFAAQAINREEQATWNIPSEN